MPKVSRARQLLHYWLVLPMAWRSAHERGLSNPWQIRQIANIYCTTKEKRCDLSLVGYLQRSAYICQRISSQIRSHPQKKSIYNSKNLSWHVETVPCLARKETKWSLWKNRQIVRWTLKTLTGRGSSQESWEEFDKTEAWVGNSKLNARKNYDSSWKRFQKSSRNRARSVSLSLRSC